MYYQEYAPPGELAETIKCFWTLEHDYSKPPMIGGERIWPDGHFEMIFTYGHPYVRKLNGMLNQVPENFLIGQFNKELLLDSNGITGLFAIRFHAWGLYPLLKRSMYSFTNQLTDLDLILDKDIEHLISHLSPTDRVESINKLMDFMNEKINGFSNDSRFVRQIAKEIYDKKGLVRISTLMSQFEIGERQIQKLFLEQVGISAKHFAKIIRFKNAKTLIEKNPEVNMAELTYECGYSDQPHFIRNFKELYGITPTEHKERTMRFKAFSK